jgi:hypothetical protein
VLAMVGSTPPAAIRLVRRTAFLTLDAALLS